MGVLHAIAVTAIAKLTVFQPTEVDIAKAVVLALLVGAAALWSAIDGWLSRTDRGRNWFIAALIAGPVSGVLGVVGRAALVDQTGINALGEALTGGAAFVALLVLVPAGLGLFVGGKLLAPRRDHSDRDDDTTTARRPATRRATPSPRPRG